MCVENVHKHLVTVPHTHNIWTINFLGDIFYWLPYIGYVVLVGDTRYLVLFFEKQKKKIAFYVIWSTVEWRQTYLTSHDSQLLIIKKLFSYSLLQVTHFWHLLNFPFNFLLYFFCIMLKCNILRILIQLSWSYSNWFIRMSLKINF